jgi:hypothetical protein
MRRFLLPVLLLATAAPALAQRGPATGSPQDTILRGSPTRADSRAWIRAEFARADLNRDGVLSRGEVTRAVGRNFGRLSTGRSRITTNMWFNRLDKDRSNSVSRGEAQALSDEFWTRFDRNRDGRIGPRERQYAQAFIKNPAR